MNRVRPLHVVLSVLLVAACGWWLWGYAHRYDDPAEQGAQARAGAETAATPSVPVPEAPLTAGQLAERLGTVGVLTGAGDSMGELQLLTLSDTGYVTASGLFPPLAALAGGARLDLFGPQGLAGRARLDPAVGLDTLLRRDPRDGCIIPWGLRLVVDYPTGTRGPGWLVAFPAGTAELLPLEPKGSDSSRLRALVQPLAQAGTRDSAGLLAGVPFAVIGWTTALRGGTRYLFATAERMKNGSDGIWRIERLFVVGERAASAPAAEQFALGYGEGQVWEFMGGPAADTLSIADAEDDLSATGIGGLFLNRRDGRPFLVLIYDHEDGSGGAVVARVGPGSWRRTLEWYSGC